MGTDPRIGSRDNDVAAENRPSDRATPTFSEAVEVLIAYSRR
jgi:hypothetical protein